MSCPIDDNCTGERWQVQDSDQLARLIAIIAMGQAAQASHILSELIPAKPAFTIPELKAEAKIRLTVQEEKQTPRTGYPCWQRDGFIFEAISWIAARQTHGETAYMKDPHVSATSQGLDGLMLELSSDKTQIDRTTVFEDKCSDDPVATFKNKVIPAFRDRHENKRSAEIIAAATALLGKAGIDDGMAAKLAAAVTDRAKRRYRAAFAVTTKLDSDDGRKALFAGYNEISGIDKVQRLGACLVVPPELRGWFDQLAEQAVAYIDALDDGAVDV
ncbi:hypothetical protein ACP90_13025 [Labrenzia sp. CP4]|nr:hypothetical protein ACP90_13025 [Labrenzia sp. CP4]